MNNWNIAQTSQRFVSRRILFRFLAVITGILALIYIYWRCTASVNTKALWFSIPLLAAELYGIVDLVFFSMMIWKPVKRVPPLPEGEPTVDVFITTYNEGREILEPTARAAMDIRWANKTVYILDDGNRGDISALAEETGCRYLTRGAEWAGKPRHAKAGNVNNALMQTAGEYILILDTDQIPDPEILNRTIGYFNDPEVALVQTPQYFYNIPPGDPFGVDAPLFYGPIMQGKDGWNAAFFCGSNGILRREALMQAGLVRYVEATGMRLRANLKSLLRRLDKDRFLPLRAQIKEALHKLSKGEAFETVCDDIRSALGETVGLPDDMKEDLNITLREEAIPVQALSTLSITEDMASALYLHSRGWKSVYHPEILAQGLSPEDLGTMLTQRLRWAQGTIQVLRRENPLTLKGLTIPQRLMYFASIYSYFSGFFTVIILSAPVIYLFTNIAPVAAWSFDFFIRFIPFFVANKIMFRVVNRGIPLWRGEQYSVALFPVWIRAVVSVYANTKITFKVTPKQRQSGNFLPLVWPQMLFIAATGAGIVYQAIRLSLGAPLSITGFTINSIWGIYNILSLSVIVRAALYTGGAKK
jgi:Glycosyltransferases, probably involved in cell wall biogenesis